jgi:hypothetical protein
LADFARTFPTSQAPFRAANARKRHHDRCGFAVCSLRSLPVAARFFDRDGFLIAAVLIAAVLIAGFE